MSLSQDSVEITVDASTDQITDQTSRVGIQKPSWYGSVSLHNSALQTPMMQQFIQIKSKVPDALLLFRMGDFYELFLEDANVAGRVLDLNVTSRNKKDQEPVPMAGIPFHALEGYLPKVSTSRIQGGYRRTKG